MKTLLLIIFVITTNRIRTQTNERDFWQPTSGPFVSEVNVFSVGSEGKLYCGTNFNGLFRSVDNGKNWQSLGLQNARFVGVITDNNGNVFVAMDSYGLFQYSDANNEWRLMKQSFTNKRISSVGVGLQSEAIVAIKNEGVYKHTVNDNWIKIWDNSHGEITTVFTDSLTGYTYIGGDGLYRASDTSYAFSSIRLSTSHKINSVITNKYEDIFVSVANDGVYRLKKGAEVWQKIFDGVVSNLSINSEGHLFLSVDYKKLFYSEYNGDSWVQIGEFNSLNSITVLSDNVLFIGTEGGVYYSSNNGKNLTQKNNGLGYNGHSSAIVRSLFVTKRNEVLVGTEYGGIYKTTNKGKTWMSSSLALPSNTPVCSFIENSKNEIFVATALGVFKLNCKTNIIEKTNLTVDTHSLIITENDTMFACSIDGLYLSQNCGKSWEKIFSKNNSNVQSLYIEDNKNMWIGTFDGIYFSNNRGKHWEKINSPDNHIKQILFINDTLLVSTSIGLFRSVDLGAHWDGILGEWITAMILTTPKNICVGTLDNGVYFSSTGGKTWKKKNSGLSTLCISSFAIDSTGVLFAGSSSLERDSGTGNGVFISTNIITSIDINRVMPDKTDEMTFTLQNYPNPFNNSTNIEFRLPCTSKVTLKVYDITGKKITTILNNKTTVAGKHIYTWNAQNISTGIYFCYLLIDNNDTKVKKMIYLK